MVHQMKLNTLPFKQISNGSKVFEIRLYDEKRQRIKVGERIIFLERPLLENKIEVKVLNLVIADNFEELFTMFDPVLAGWEKNDSPNKCADEMSKYYSKEEQNNYGVLAIEIESLSH